MRRVVISLVVVVLLSGAAYCRTLFHWSFDGTYGEEILAATDIVAGEVAYKFRDAEGPDPSYDVRYGSANVIYNTAGTSAQFENDPASNDPGVGMRVPDSGVDSGLDLSTVGAFTIEAFVYPYDNRQAVIIRKNNKAADGGIYYIDTRSDGHFGIRLAGPNADTGDSGGLCYDLPLQTDQWQHVALVWDGSAAKFYVDGIRSQNLSGGAEVPFTGPVGDSSKALGIGCIVRDNLDPPASSGQFFNGRIDELRISDEALAPSGFLLSVQPGPASNPRPVDGGRVTSTEVVLQWDSGLLADAHEVYFGTDFNQVSDWNDPNIPPGRGRTDQNSYNAGELTAGLTYYWRIDEVGPGGTARGDVWSFTVARTYTNSLGMEFVQIDAGSFVMGSTEGDFDELPVHNVTISRPFFISRYEVTNSQYEQFDPNHGLIDHRGFTHGPNEAVIFVSWEDANAFCRWLSGRESLPYRLPTEAEWEYACRAGTTTAYHTGETLPSAFLKNAEETWGPEPVPLDVGNTPANPWGLYDMHGNVEEWCYDWYGPYVGGDQVDPIGRVAGRFRVCRGGSHSTTVQYLRSANRMGTLPQDKHWLIGFRPVIAEMPGTEPLPEPPPQLYQTNVDQNIPPDINEGPDPDIPYFEGPRTYVKIAPGSEGPLFSAHNHDPGFTHCANGDLLAIWYTTRREPGRELALAASRLRYGHDEWEDASPFWDAPDRNDHAPALWIDENGKLYQFCGLADAATWAALALVMRTSADNGVTWSPAVLIDPEHTYEHMPVESVLRTSGGSIVLPLDKNPGTHLYLSDDDGLSWYYPGGRIYGIHAGVVELGDGRLMAFGRGDNIDDRMPMSISTDTGASWTYSASEFPPISGGQRLVVRRLKEGPILFISFTGSDGMVIDGRQVYGMFAAVSYDDGLSWPVKKLITAGGPPRVYDGGGNTGVFTMDDTHAEPRGYLAMTQRPNGVIELISSALHYSFNLAWLEHKDYRVIDDFESYSDEGGDNPIGDTWRDGTGDANNGALVSLETGANVRGYKSMRFAYDCTRPCCRAVRTYGSGQDWTAEGSRAMAVWFFGDAANPAGDRIYIRAADVNGNWADVFYAGEANHISEPAWHQWDIDLEDFNGAGVGLRAVNSVAVGVSGSGAGQLWFDDLRLYPPRCLPQFGPAADLNEDCVVDGEDLAELASGWLGMERIVAGVPADANRLLLWYRFDETSGDIAEDYSGRAMHGYVDGPESGWQPGGGHDGGCRVFNDDTDVEVPTQVLAGVEGQISVTVWLNGIYRADSDNWLFDTGWNDCFVEAIVVTAADHRVMWRAGYSPGDVLLWDLDGRDPQELADQWHHWAFVKDANQGLMRIYFDGQVAAEKSDAFGSPAAAVGAAFDIGASLPHHNDYIGKMDDFKVYRYALSQAEVVGAATGGGDLVVAAPDCDRLHRDGKVDFRDYAVLAGQWLQQRLWP